MSGKVTVHYEDFDLTDGDYTSASGKAFKVWTQPDGQWVCAAYDHGPFCRRCTLLDPTGAACVSYVIKGLIDIFDDPDKGLAFRITRAGTARVETAIRRGGFDAGLDA